MMINEAANILADGIAKQANDIDLATVHGHGFVCWRGGLIYYADQIGVSEVLGCLLEFVKEDSLVWRPS